MIRADGLGRSFDGRPAVEDLSFKVPKGSLCALLGPNGAGKTTTVRLLLGLLPLHTGSAEVAGIALPASDAAGAILRGRAGLLTESPGFYDRISGRDNLVLFGRLYGIDEVTLERRVEHWLRRLELWEAKDRAFGTWSKGMKQRLALIRAVLHEPSVIFLDEPTSGLDPRAAREVRDLIAALRSEGRTILLCTHNLAEAGELADLIGIMRRRMIAFGTPAALTAGEPRVDLVLLGDATPLVDPLRRFPGVRGAAAVQNRLELTLDDLERDTPAVVAQAVRLGAALLQVRPRAPSLEEVYLRALEPDPA